jgi:uroporphyrinogen III methyltransferase/synthase
VALIRWGTTPQQETLEGTLATIADRVAQTGFAAPALIVIGDVVKLRNELNWFERRPLFGRRVVVTRERDQARDFVRGLLEQGAEVLEIPAIRFGPPTEHRPVVDAIAGLNSYDWIVFTSANGVHWFFDAFFKGFQDLRDIGGVKIAAVGPVTAVRLRELHLQVDVVPKVHDARHLVNALNDFQGLENLRFLLPRAEVATPELPRLLEALGGIVDDVAFYRTEPETEAGVDASRLLTEAGADWVTFTSGSTVRNFHSRVDLHGLRDKFPELKLASIGPETSEVLRKLGSPPAVEANPQTTEGLIEAILRHRGP